MRSRARGEGAAAPATAVISAPVISAPVIAVISATAAAAASACVAAHRAGYLPGGSSRWARTNHAGEEVTLTEGVALTVGTALPLLVADPPAAATVLGAGVAGAVDDLAGESSTKGLRGHLSALRRGQVTTGTLKIALLGGAGLLGCAWSDARQRSVTVPRTPHRHHSPTLHTLLGAALVAGSANLANLLDLRPGRALKVGLVHAIPLGLGGSPAAAAVGGAGLAVVADDLAGRSMLGDTGANPLGAAVGLAAAQRLGTGGRALALLGVTGLVLLSERVSFTRVIERTPWLRALDEWGRPR
ncbi:hypothetical protein ACQBAT_09075 [Ornithinimicrobium sp. Y1847]|uniref:hypothetical protein n=1 Tax=unclassified Ornithinimicrobium TaxID=2615080 RepID=UPI003B682769